MISGTQGLSGAEFIEKIFNENGIPIDNDKAAKFMRFYEYLIEWNQKMNLTAITEFEDVVRKHFLDSCLLIKLYGDYDFAGKTIIDIGTGPGFPGIPLAIMMEDTSFTLVDSLNKRVNFVNEVVSALGLSNVSTVCARAEDLARDDMHREKYDYLVSRAVASMSVLLELCSPFISIGGKLMFYKSKKTEEEVKEAENAFAILKCKTVDIRESAIDEGPDSKGSGADIPGKRLTGPSKEAARRNIVEIEKTDNTPEKYPRRAGKLQKKPL